MVPVLKHCAVAWHVDCRMSALPICKRLSIADLRPHGNLVMCSHISPASSPWHISPEHQAWLLTTSPIEQVRVSRQRILDSALKVMSLYAGSRAVLELEYFGEAGTGLGPTLEFFTLLSHELQRKGLRMWRSDHTGGLPL